MIGKFAAAPMSLFGYGARKELKPLLLREKITKALIVTDEVLQKLGISEIICNVLMEAGIAFTVYAGVCPNPTIENVEDGVRIFNQEGCDDIISIGGGSANDCAKAIRILAAGKGDIRDYQGGNKSVKKGVFLVAVNTTAGTASEVSRAYLISDEKKQRKLIFKDDYAMPSIAVNDTELMMGLPKAITAQTGMDALTHAIESYSCTNRFLLSDILAKDAMELIYRYLPVAVERPDSVEARDGMAYGQYLAGLSFGSAGLGLVHAMAHQLGATYHLPHGLCNAVLLPVVMQFQLDSCIQPYSEIARLLKPKLAAGKSRLEQAQLAINLVKNLSKQVGTDIALKDLGVREEDLQILAEKTLEDGCINTSPRMPDAAQVMELFSQAMG